MLYVDILHNLTNIAVTDIVPVDPPVAYPAIPAVISLDQFRFAQSSPHGGMFWGEYGNLVMALDLFPRIADIGGALGPDVAWWPPPQFLEQVTVGWVDKSGALWQAPQLFTAWLETWSAAGAVYSLRPTDLYDETVTDYHYTGTVVEVFTSAASTLGLTLNATTARAVPPPIDWVATGTNRILDNLDQMAKWSAHACWIDGSTLWLADTQVDSASGVHVLTMGDVIGAEYLQPPPYRKFSAPFDPPRINRVRLKMLERQGGTTGGAAVAAVKVPPSNGGGLEVPTTIQASNSRSGYPVSNLVDGNAATMWIGDSTPSVTVTAIVSSRQIVEYALTASTNVTATPARWQLYAYNEWTFTYDYVALVESGDWTAGEVRRFQVPDQINWQVEADNSYTSLSATYRLGDTYTVQPACNPSWSYINSALAYIKTEMTRKRCRYSLPIQGINPRARVSLTDNYTTPGRNVVSWARVDALVYDFAAGTMVVEGGGGWV